MDYFDGFNRFNAGAGYKVSSLPAAGIRHARPGFGRFEIAVLEQFHRDPVGRLDEGHVPIARGAVDGVAGLEQALAGLVDVLDPVGEMAEIAPAGIFLGGNAVLGGQL